MSLKATFNSLRTFLFIWFGQLISLTGSGLTAFALGIWVYQKTGSVTLLALVSLFAVIPDLLIAPLAGVFVDRLDRRLIMILSDSGAALNTLVLALLLVTGRLEVWHIYIIRLVATTMTVFQYPAYASSTPLLVPQEQIGRANGLVQAAQAASQILSPLIAGALLLSIKLEGIILIDFATFLFAVTTLLLIRIPLPAKTEEKKSAKNSMLKEAQFGLTYITARPGLFGLLLLFTAVNFMVGIVSVMVTPLVLSFSTPAVLGSLLSLGGFGMLTGSVLMSVWGGPKRKVFGMLGFMFLGGLSIVLGGIQPNTILLGIASVSYFIGLPVVSGCFNSLIHSKVEPGVQGRVFSTVWMISGFCLPLSYLVAGPLADKIFEPLMAVDGSLANSVGRIIGVGPGRGIGLMFILAGICLILITIIGFLSPRLRNVDIELPDIKTPTSAEPQSIPATLAANTD